MMIFSCLLGFPGGSVVKNLPASSGDVSSIPGLGRPLEGGHGNSLQYSCLGKSKAHGAWWATIYRVEKELGMTKQLNNSNSNKLLITSVSSIAQLCLLCATPLTAAQMWEYNCSLCCLLDCDFAKNIIFRKFKKQTPWDFLHMQSYYLSIEAIFFLSFPYLCGFKFFSFLIKLTRTCSLILNVIRKSRNSLLFNLSGKAVSLIPNMELAIGFWQMFFIKMQKVLIYSQFTESSYHGVLSKVFYSIINNHE